MSGEVICGIEDADGAAVATMARDLAKRYRLPLLYVHVRENGEPADRTARLLRDVAAPGKVVVEKGHPADRLVELARQRAASFLVLGNHGPRSSMLGSISADVARRAPCPVMIVPSTVDPADHAVRADRRPKLGGSFWLHSGRMMLEALKRRRARATDA